MKGFATGLAMLTWLIVLASDGRAVEIEWVTVGNPGNTPDSTGYGRVAQVYQIAKYEVTNAQYTAFLNAVDPDGENLLQLYDPWMDADRYRGGIAFDAARSSGSKYTAKPNMANKPVNYVSFFDSLRFANWLEGGDTENGTYMLEGQSPVPINAHRISRNADAIVFLPDDDEWYKAAYYEPGASQNSYWTYATRSDKLPTPATATPTGEIANAGPNVVNYGDNAHWNGTVIQGNVTTVGSSGPLSLGYYGTSDMNGNVWEWVQADLVDTQGFVRGGHWGSHKLEPFWREEYPAGVGKSAIGFRVARLPEPSTLTLAVIGLLGLLAWGCRRRGAGRAMR